MLFRFVNIVIKIVKQAGEYEISHKSGFVAVGRESASTWSWFRPVGDGDLRESVGGVGWEGRRMDWEDVGGELLFYGAGRGCQLLLAPSFPVVV